jgi:3,4-dihydroxy 2-butanone 4-phosphate synthase/GTP cyclohydrolase II
MAAITRAGAGVIVYLGGHEGRGIGLLDKLRAYELQDAGRDTVDANIDLGLPVDAREYANGAQILLALGIGSVRLLTNNPAKATGLEQHGVSVAEQLPIVIAPTGDNLRYLQTKAERMGHHLPDVPRDVGAVLPS